jgi:hypothetical protein
MKRFLKRFLFVIFFQILYFFTVFYVEEFYYPHWLGSFVLVFGILVILSTKAIRSAKKELELKNALTEYAAANKVIDDIRNESLKLSFTCPKCETENTYWAYLENGNCPKCGSNLWPTKIKTCEDIYDKLFKKNEKARSYIRKLPGWILRAARNSQTYYIPE